MNHLREYQRAAVERMLSMEGNILLADEPGLGKTPTAIEYANRLRPDDLVIVCPASLRLNWRAELERWLTYRPACIDVLSYEGMTKRPLTPVPERKRLVVFDEAHYLKNPKAKRTKAALKLKQDKILFLTGTPVVNRPIDLYPILSLCSAKLTRMEYGKRFCAGKLVQVGWRPSRWVWDFSGASNTEELNAALLIRLYLSDGTYETGDLETDITSTVPSVATHASGGEYEGGWTAPFVMRVKVSGNQRPVIRQKSPVSFSWINWREVLP